MVGGSFLCGCFEVGVCLLCGFEGGEVGNQCFLLGCQGIVSCTGCVDERLRSIGVFNSSDSTYLFVNSLGCCLVCGSFLCSCFEVGVCLLCRFKGGEVGNQCFLVSCQGIVSTAGCVNERLRGIGIGNLSDSTYLFVNSLGCCLVSGGFICCSFEVGVCLLCGFEGGEFCYQCFLVSCQGIVSCAGCVNERLRSVSISNRSDSTYLIVNSLGSCLVSGGFLSSSFEVGIRFLRRFEGGELCNQCFLLGCQGIVSTAGCIDESLRSISIGNRSDSTYLIVRSLGCCLVGGGFLCSSFEVGICFLRRFEGGEFSNQCFLVSCQGIVSCAGCVNERLRSVSIGYRADSTYLIVHRFGDDRGIQFSY